MYSPRVFSRINSSYDNLLDQAGRRYNVDPQLLKLVFHLESNGNPNIGSSKAGAAGPFQFMPATAQEMIPGMDPNNINQAAFAAAKYLRQGLDATGSISGALRYYNAGPNQSHWNNDETNAYVRDAQFNWNRMYPSADNGVTNVAQRGSQSNDQIIKNTVDKYRNQPQQQAAPTSSDEFDFYLNKYIQDRNAQANASGKPSSGTQATQPLAPADEFDQYSTRYDQQKQQQQTDTAQHKATLQQAGGEMSAGEAFLHGLGNGVALGHSADIAKGAANVANAVTSPLEKIGAITPGTSGDQVYNQVKSDEQRAASSHSWAFNLGAMFGNAVTYTGLYVGTRGAALKYMPDFVGTTLGKAVAEAAGGGAVGGTNAIANGATPEEAGKGAAVGAMLAGGGSLAGTVAGTVAGLGSKYVTPYLGPIGNAITGLVKGGSELLNNPFTRAQAAATAGGLQSTSTSAGWPSLTSPDNAGAGQFYQNPFMQ